MKRKLNAVLNRIQKLLLNMMLCNCNHMLYMLYNIRGIKATQYLLALLSTNTGSKYWTLYANPYQYNRVSPLLEDKVNSWLKGCELCIHLFCHKQKVCLLSP